MYFQFICLSISIVSKTTNGVLPYNVQADNEN